MNRILARVLVVVACVAMIGCLLAGYAWRAVVDSDQFANRATAALADESVRTLIADKITDDVVLAHQADLLAARPIIASVASDIVGSPAFLKLFRSSVRDVHRAVFDRDEDTVTLTVKDVGTVLAAAIEKLRPSLARQVESAGQVTLVKQRTGSLAEKLASLARTVRLLALVLAALCVALVAGALFLAPDRRRAVVELGLGAAVAGVFVAAALGIARSLAVHHVAGPEAQAAAGAVWDAFLGDLRTAAWLLAGIGAVVAAAASSVLRPVAIGEPLRRAGARLLVEPIHPWMRALRAVALIAVGLFVALAHDAVISLVLTAAGIYLVYEGVTALLRLVYRPPDPREEPHRRARPRRLVPAVVAVAVSVAAVGVFVATGNTTTAAPASGACDGHRQLCDRPLDQVALVATHNAMSVPLPGWYSAEQDAPIADQLSDGVRGLLLDTHYADRLPDGKLRTYFGSSDEMHRQAEQDGVSPDAVDAALRIRDRLGFTGKGERGMYLCHTFCELGGTTLGSVLHDIHQFLVANPDEVLVVINQDYVRPDDFVGAVRDAGLESFTYRGPVTGRWLTLRQMIDSNQRLVLLAENKAGAASWYRPAYESITEETPYTFTRVAQLTDPPELPASCEPNRGPANAPIFLVNHWISTDPVPLPSHASQVNAYTPLLGRMRACEKQRHHLPNLVAVNFYRRGDVFRVVDTLNGIGR